MLKKVFIIFIIKEALANVPENSSDIIIYGGHADLPEDHAVFITTRRHSVVTTTTLKPESKEFLEQGTEKGEELKDDVVFVPTEGDIFHLNNVAHEDTLRMGDVLRESPKNIYSLMKEKEETEAPQDILFISGKNNERQERPSEPEREKKSKYGVGGRRGMDYEDEPETTTKKRIRLKCKQLTVCDNTISSVCGARKERAEVKYRLFLNECYFRKVNCAFTNKISRYEQVELEMCKNVAAHAPRRTDIHYQYYPEPERPSTTVPSSIGNGRRMAGRRSMTMNYIGGYCGHECPAHCPEEYEPICALNANGERRVFANHCLLDRTSCQFQLVWRLRPLAECVGGKKADMHQNKGFINWMQQVGIVDKMGRLVLN